MLAKCLTALKIRRCTRINSPSIPVVFIHAANDYDTSAGRALATELERLNKPHILKIYPPFGQSQDDGHNLVYYAVPVWEAEVFAFLNRYVGR